MFVPGAKKWHTKPNVNLGIGIRKLHKQRGPVRERADNVKL